MHANAQKQPCDNEGKKKPTKNRTTAAITPRVRAPLFTSHLVTGKSCFSCSQEFLN